MMVAGGARLDLRRVREILEGYFSPLPVGIEEKVGRYTELLRLWGEKMPLTSAKDGEGIVRLLFGESIFGLKLGSGGNGRLADVGSGAGFPGLALKMAKPELPVALVEPNKKKCAFLHEVTRALELEGVKIISVGFENSDIEDDSIATVTCRALGLRKGVLRWSKRVLTEGGEILLWLGKEGCEEARNVVGWSWGTPVLIPGTKARYILRGSPGE